MLSPASFRKIGFLVSRRKGQTALGRDIREAFVIVGLVLEGENVA